MPCYRPLLGYKGPPNENGKAPWVYQRKNSFRGAKMDVPCGQCIGCRLERSRQWAMRCVHEAFLYDDNCFLTLTYDDDHLPSDHSLDLTHFQKFMKRLRKKFPEKPIRFFHCGEYGDDLGRPHYHALLFNFDFPDKQLFKTSHGFKLYDSKILNDLWQKGFCLIGDVTFESASYCARYILKKITNKETRICPRKGTVWISAAEWYAGKKPEYTTMSRGGSGKGLGGLGNGWFEIYGDEVYEHDSVVVRGKETKPPKFYDSQMEKKNPDKMALIKKARISKASILTPVKWKGLTFLESKNDPQRLRVAEIIKIAQTKTLKRSLDDN